MRCRGKSARAKRISEVSSEGGKSAAIDLRVAYCGRVLRVITGGLLRRHRPEAVRIDAPVYRIHLFTGSI